MKRLLNTLYVTKEGSYLFKEGETVVVKHEGKRLLQVPVRTLGGIVCFGPVTASPPLLGMCVEQGVTVTYLTIYGRFLARVEGPVSGNVLVRREQYLRAEDADASCEIARAVIIGKLANSRTVLRRFIRDYPEHMARSDIERSISDITASLDDLERRECIDEVRGVEGDGARCYFGVFDHLIVSQKSDFSFQSRTRRPPLDNVNCLLSFVYSLLTHDLRSACETAGLDPQAGFLHRFRAGRPSLALDLMEEFRPFFAERLVLSLINRRQVQSRGFTRKPTGAVFMDEETRKALLVAYQKRKQEEILHPFLGEKVPVGLLFHCQALLLSRFLRGDLDGYPPFIWR